MMTVVMLDNDNTNCGGFPSSSGGGDPSGDAADTSFSGGGPNGAGGDGASSGRFGVADYDDQCRGCDENGNYCA